MKVTTSEVEGSQVVLDIEIEPERVDKAMERAYRRIASRVNVPGFRRGKAPRVLIERVVGRDSLMNEAIEILVPEAYEEAVRETGIEPVDSPKLDVVSAEPLSVRATVPVRPKVELGDYRAIRQSQEPVEVSDEEVERTLESLREARGQWVSVERAARSGDTVTLELRGKSDDQLFVDTKDLLVLLDPDRPLLAPGVIEQLIGVKSGEQKTIEITLPEDFSEKELAGKPATLEVTANEIKEKQVPELDDDLARSLGDYSSVEDLRAGVRRGLEAQAEAQARRNLEESVVAAVVDQATVDLPVTWVDEQANSLRETMESSLRQQGLTFEQFLRFSNRTEESYRDETLSAARRQVKRMLVLNAVAKQENIAVSDEEVEKALQEALATREGKMSAQERDDFRANLRSLLRERKTLARLVEIAEGRESARGAAEVAEPETPAEAESQPEELE